ncbi:class 1 fructose-bisphosphatase [Methylobacterium sp. NEAU 140]|uniref:class 1 fructose-bisphosphatase n=1 Tax=Methylobacterium sp. NEAU 140 TaxID=3064945 RepID=UPI002734EB02|nr:class 1 fructose-bisphosphatase [Methylobacterium sp. NEAU 140]MDP4023514.1 class 1 fructose-bisphosphatase [Methylobacterium sp. NEAU 140]
MATVAVGTPLDVYLSEAVAARPALKDAAATIAAIAAAAVDISEVIGRGALGGDLAATGETNSDGDVQKALDVIAHERVTEALRGAPVAFVASEEADAVMVLDAGAPLAVAIDPLDGSSNIGVNMAVGTVFGIRPAVPGDDHAASFRTPGKDQVAAGFVSYGPATALIVTLGEGTQSFVLDRAAGAFRLTNAAMRVPETAKEYAINASNVRHWDGPIKAYVEDCLRGTEGPRDKDFNMRWLGSMVADIQRVLTRGGVFLYPGDSRKGYSRGRLRLLYEAAPIALLIEQAGGAATDGEARILDVVAAGAHDRSPLVCGSREEVACVAAYHGGGKPDAGRSPLFGQRGLMRS